MARARRSHRKRKEKHYCRTSQINQRARMLKVVAKEAYAKEAWMSGCNWDTWNVMMYCV